MIRNLNQQGFKSFGFVCSEREYAVPASVWSDRQTLSLQRGNSPVYYAAGETWLNYGPGQTVLSVSNDGEDFQHFYLDKTVRILPGIYFCLSPFRHEASSAVLSARIAPQHTGKFCKFTDFQLSRRIQIANLYTFFYHEKERGFLFPGESHSMLELTYVDQGSLHSVADGQDLLLEQGDMAIYGSNQWHMQYADTDVAPRFVTISFDLDDNDALKPLLNRKLRPPQSAISLLHKLIHEQERMDEFSIDIMISQLSLLLLYTLQRINAPQAGPRPSNSIHSENQIIGRAQQYISSHIREKLSVPIVAQRVGVSPSYLTALFHQNLQISPGEYIRRIKLQESKQMIRENSMNFTEIAAALQYSTVHHFSRQFKDKFGITPSEYARSVR